METAYKQLVGKKIRKLRKEEKLTLEELADRAGMNPAYLAKVERGEMNVTLGTLEKIALGLNIKMSKLLCLEEEPIDSAMLRKEIASLVNKADIDPGVLMAVKRLLQI